MLAFTHEHTHTHTHRKQDGLYQPPLKGVYRRQTAESVSAGWCKCARQLRGKTRLLLMFVFPSAAEFCVCVNIAPYQAECGRGPEICCFRWSHLPLSSFAVGERERATPSHDGPPTHAPVGAKAFQPTSEFTHCRCTAPPDPRASDPLLLLITERFLRLRSSPSLASRHPFC